MKHELLSHISEISGKHTHSSYRIKGPLFKNTLPENALVKELGSP